MNNIQTFFGFEILVGIFVGVLFATIVVLIMHIRGTAQINKMTFPAYEYAMKKAEHEAQGLIAAAQKQARAVIASAEQAGHETIADYTNQATEIHEKYKEVITGQTQQIELILHDATQTHTHTLEVMLDSTKGALLAEQEKATQTVVQTNKTLQAVAAKAEQHTQETIAALEERITKVGQTIESNLLKSEQHTHDSVVSLEEYIAHIKQTLEQSLQKAEAVGEEKLTAYLESLQATADAHIAAYETSRTRLMDAHIEQLVESVIKKVLHTQLPVSEHASLARKALEEAKSKHIL